MPRGLSSGCRKQERQADTPDVTYIASILFKSREWKYLVTNASWIAGSVVTIFLDFIILGQFAYFSWQDKQRARVFIDDDDAESV